MVPLTYVVVKAKLPSAEMETVSLPLERTRPEPASPVIVPPKVYEAAPQFTMIDFTSPETRVADPPDTVQV